MIAPISDLRLSLLSEATLTFVDVETTGLSPAEGDRVCEIALIRQEPGQKPNRYSSFVDPGRGISPGAFAVNKITVDMLAGAPQFQEVIDQVYEMMVGSVLVAHNAPFDLGFLRAEYALCGREFPDCPVIDTVQFARRHFNFVSNRLGSVARALHITPSRLHRAMADCRTTQRVLDAMVREVYADAVPTIAHLLGSIEDFPVIPVTDWTEAEKGALPPSMADMILRNPVLSITYVSAEGRRTHRQIRVYGLIPTGRNTYLAAHCLMCHEDRQFRLDRIIDWEPVASGRQETAATVPKLQDSESDGIMVRPLRRREIRLLHALWDTAGLHYRPNGRDSVQYLRREWSENKLGFLGAFVGEVLAGFVLASSDGRRGWINRLAVDPRYRHRGVAQRLIEVGETELRRRGMLVIGALIDTENAASRELFAKCGYHFHDGIVYYSKRDSVDA